MAPDQTKTSNGGEPATPEIAAPRRKLDTAPYTLISQGAEARVWSGSLFGRPIVVKERFRKMYRHPTLDSKLTQQRLRAEVRGLLRARKLGVRTPVPYATDATTGSVWLGWLEGPSVRAALHGWQQRHGPEARPRNDPRLCELLRAIGAAVGKLHDGGLVHGDLTTSNMLVVQGWDTENGSEAGTADGGAAATLQAPEDRGKSDTPGDVVSRDAGAQRPPTAPVALALIDFGLSSNSTIPEDKGVDLYVLERAFLAAHATHGEQMFEIVIEAYRRSSRFWSATLNRFAEVRMRGRKRSMVG